MYWYFDRIRKTQKELNIVENDLLEVHSYCKLEMANCFFEQGQRERAEHLYLDALRVDPSFQRITDNIMQLADSYQSSSQPNKAISLLLTSLKHHKQFKKAKDYLVKCGEKWVKNGERTKAYGLFTELTKICPHEKKNLENLQWNKSIEWRRNSHLIAISEKMILAFLVKICSFMTNRRPTDYNIAGNISGENFYLLDNDFLEFYLIPEELEIREEQRTCYVQSGEMIMKKESKDLNTYLNSHSFASSSNQLVTEESYSSLLATKKKQITVRSSLPEIKKVKQLP